MAVSMLLKVSKFQQTFLLQGAKGILPSQIGQHWFSTDPPNDTSSSSDEENGSKEKVETIREEILGASLPFVTSHGWTKNAISAGAETIGYPGVVHGMFPRGGVELIQYFYVSCNQKLVGKMKKEADDTAPDLTKKKVPSAFIQDAVETRLRMIVPYLDKWPQAIGIMSLPPNVPTTLANLLTLVDDICYYAGDRSVDFSWYSRRIALAGIYKMTELCMIQDKSEDFTVTWQFLARRIDDVEHLHNYLHQSEEVSQVAKEAVTSAFITARNILGLTLGNR